MKKYYFTENNENKMLYVQSLSSTRATDKTTEVLEEVEFPFVICFQFLIFNLI